MANLKELRNRIGSVKSTQKITKAMKMVAASKLRRAQDRAEEARPYAQKMSGVIQALSAGIIIDQAPELLVGRRNEFGEEIEQNHLLIIITSDRGLCGGLNGGLVRLAKQEIRKLQNKEKNVRLLIFGKKGYELLRREFEDIIVDHNDLAGRQHPEYGDAYKLSRKANELFENGEIDCCTILFNRFQSALSQTPVARKIIPLELDNSNDDGNENQEQDSVIYDYEPSEAEVLERLLPINLGVQVYRGLLENIASEHGARMTAMDNATRNAGEMINKLTLQYNRSRQAAITTELTEIVAGAEAL